MTRNKILKFGLICLTLWFGALINVQAQAVENAIKTNLLNYPFKTWNVQYERQVKGKHSLQVGWAKIDGSWFVDTYMDGSYYTLDYRKYLPYKKPARLSYISPYLRYQDIYFENDTEMIQVKGLGGGFLIGKVILPKWSNTLLFDLHGGVNYFPENYELLSQNPVSDMPLPASLYGFGFRLGFSLGFRF